MMRRLQKRKKRRRKKRSNDSVQLSVRSLVSLASQHQPAANQDRHRRHQQANLEPMARLPFTCLQHYSRAQDCHPQYQQQNNRAHCPWTGSSVSLKLFFRHHCSNQGIIARSFSPTRSISESTFCSRYFFNSTSPASCCSINCLANLPL